MDTKAEIGASGDVQRPMRVLSGIQPSGTLHLGNYYGAIAQHIELAEQLNDKAKAFYFIANYHSLTTVQEGARLRALVQDVALDYLALGLDPSKATFFRQSDVPEVVELAWFLACVTGKGLLERAHSYKDKVARGLEPSMGLFTYPILMAADILIYRSTLVPVGRDQQQHVEMAQDMAQSFNAAFPRPAGMGPVLFRPEWRFSSAPVVPGLDGQKMSKSYGNTIPIFVPPQMTEKQAWKTWFSQVVTDSKGVDEPKSKEDTVLVLYKLLDPSGASELEPEYLKGGVGYGELKKRLQQAHTARFEAARQRRAELTQHPDFVEDVLVEGARRARSVAAQVLLEVREVAGITVAAHTHRLS